MRIIYIILVISLLLTGCMPVGNKGNGYHQYIKTNGLEKPTDVDYQTILFIDKDTGFLAGDLSIYNHPPRRDSLITLPSKIMAMCWKTENGGYSWREIFAEENANFKLLKQDKENIYGLVARKTETGDSSIIYESRDQGESWNIKTSLDILVYDFYFRDSLCGVIFGGVSGKNYNFLTTSDGGKNWKKPQPPGWRHLQQLDDSMAYYIYKGNPTIDTNYYLVGWNYTKEKQEFSIKLPYRYLYKYRDGILALDDEHKRLSLYELTPDFTLKFLHTFDYTGSRVDYIAKHHNKIYIKFNSFMTKYVFFSPDGGKTWHKRDYYSIMSFGPQYVLKEQDTLRFWLMTFDNYITTFKN